VRTSLGAAHARAGSWSEARAALDDDTVREAIARDPLPGLLARRWLGLALCRLGETTAGSSLLTSGAFAYGDALEPSMRFVADVNVLHDLAERARRGELDRAAAESAIERVATFEAVHTLLARRVASARRSLRSASRAAVAIEALAIAAGRLA